MVFMAHKSVWNLTVQFSTPSTGSTSAAVAARLCSRRGGVDVYNKIGS